jgi:DNA-binding MarR family transcriptional regulator
MKANVTDRTHIDQLFNLVREISTVLNAIEPLQIDTIGSPDLQDVILRNDREEGNWSDRLVRHTRTSLPDPKLVRRIIRQRRLRGQYFDANIFADPAWDILLDLTAAHAEHMRVSVTSLCIASEVPPTTALRWIGLMTDSGLLERVEDSTDRRRAFVRLSDKGVDAMARYFARLEKHSALVK